MSASSSNWGELWDQPEAASSHTQKGIEYLEKYALFLKERAAIEEEYASKLRALAKKNLGKKKEDEDLTKSFSYVNSFVSFLRELESIAGQHELIAEGFRKDIHPAVMAKCSVLRSTRKTHLNELQTATSSLNMSVDNMFKYQKNYMKAFKEAEAAHFKYDKAEKNMDLSRADLEKAKANAVMRTQACEEAKQNYAYALQTANQKQDEYYRQTLPNILQLLHALDAERISDTRSFMEQSTGVETKVMSIMQRCYEDMLNAVHQISAENDTAIVVEQFRTGYALPQPIVFEDLGPPSAAVTGEGTSSTDSPSAATLKRGLLSSSGSRNGTARNLPRKSSMHQKLFGGGSSNHHHKETVGDYQSYPPQQKCRRLQKKIEQLEKEIATKEHSKDGLTKMLQVYTNNPKLGNAGDVEAQITEYDKEVKSLIQQLAKYKQLLTSAQSELNTPLSSIRSEVPQRPPPPSQTSQNTSPHSSPLHCSTPVSTLAQRASYSEDSISSDGSSALSNHQISPSRSAMQNIKELSTSIKCAVVVDKNEVYEECDTPALGTCVALYPFEGGSEGTMAMKESDELLLIEKDEGDGWTRVRHVASNSEGFVPTSYLQCNWYPDH